MILRQNMIGIPEIIRALYDLHDGTGPVSSASALILFRHADVFLSYYLLQACNFFRDTLPSTDAGKYFLSP